MFRIMETPANGPAPRYTDCDLFYVMKVIESRQNRGKRSGRNSLSDAAGIGTGTVRGICGKLREMGFAETYSTGTVLTEEGLGFLESLGIELLNLSRTDSAIGNFQVSLLVKKSAHKILKGTEQRNHGLRAGGDGCTAIVFRNGTLFLPPDWNIDEKSPELALEIRSSGIEEGDAVLIGGSDTGRRFAAAAAVTAAFALL